ncbi:MAG: cytochrome d ubiquinol oxidase subunit II [Hyphomicrobiales bacterium]
MIEEAPLQVFWAAVLGFSVLIYLVLDGFDLGVGALFGMTSDETFKRKMLDTIAPVWDGNETWLIIVGASLYGAFPVVYAILLPALYLPVGLMLIALILRGVTFEFRYKTLKHRQYLDTAFFAGSLIVSFVLGAAVGAISQEIAIENGAYSGGAFDWLTFFTAACGLGMVCGHLLLGASWVILKTDGPLRDWAYERVPIVLSAAVLFLAIVHTAVFYQHKDIAAAYTQHPVTLASSFFALGAAFLVFIGYKRRVDWMPFAFSSAMFVFAFCAAAFTFWPFILPFSLTIEQAAAPHASLQFMFYGAGLVALPVTLIYTAAVFWIFRGKITDDTSYDL